MIMVINRSMSVYRLRDGAHFYSVCVYVVAILHAPVTHIGQFYTSADTLGSECPVSLMETRLVHTVQVGDGSDPYVQARYFVFQVALSEIANMP